MTFLKPILDELRKQKHVLELLRHFRNGNVQVHNGKLYIPGMRLGWLGEWEDQIRTADGRLIPLGARPNTGTYEGWDHALMNEYKNGPKSIAWYIGIGQTQVTPTEGWTGVTYPSLAGEITTYTGNRPAWAPSDAASGVMDTETKSPFVAPAGGMTVWNNGLLNSTTKGDTAPGTVLASAAVRAAAAVIAAGDTYETGFRVTMTDNSP